MISEIDPYICEYFGSSLKHEFAGVDLENRACTEKRKLAISHFGSLFSFLKILLSLAEFSQVEGGNFFSLLNLLLVGLDLLLKLASQLNHTFLVLMIFISLELKLLDTAFSLLEALVGFASFSLDRAQLNFKLSDARFKFCHGVSTT